MKSIKFDFENGLVEIEEDNDTVNTLCDPELESKHSAILKAAGLEQVPAEELANAVDDLLSNLGFDGVTVAR